MERHVKQAMIGSLLVLAVIVVFGVAAVIRYFTPGKEWMELSEYYSVPEGEAILILNDTVHERNARLIDGRIYVDLATVQQYFNHRFYWDETEEVLSYTTPRELFRAGSGEAAYQVTADANATDYAVVWMLDGVYVSLDFVAEYSDISYNAYTASDTPGEPVQRVLVSCTHEDYLYTDALKKTQIRVEPDRKSEIVAEVQPGDTLMLLEGGGTQQSHFLEVMTEDGVRGYVNKRHVGEGYYEAKGGNYTAPEYTSIHQKEKVNLVWHYVETQAANNRLEEMLNGTEGINVISPTWFRLNGSDGDFTSIASAEYVREAHSRDISVWGLVKNFDTGTQVDTYKVLSITSSRDRLIDGLVQEALAFHLDGINVDFETLTVDAGPHFIQFLRELSVKCRNSGLVLSVDNYVPANYNRYYDYVEQGKIVDYVVIMAYDEHTSISENAGSVASISYVENAIADTIAMVPAEKLIVGIPFYTRLWKEVVEEDVTVVSIAETPVMRSAEKIVEDRGITPVWDEETAQYYAEYQENGAIYRIWLEEERSIGEKLVRVMQAGAAGVAAWRLGQEKPEVWSVIMQYLGDAQ